MFASRHVVCTLITLHNLWPTNIYLHAIANYAMILGASRIASYITDTHGSREKRTTNTMPYPPHFTPDMQQMVKKEYAQAQFSATLASILPDANANWGMLLPIQMAPLLMTLVRKGKVRTITYHRVYAISLYFCYVVNTLSLASSDDNAYFCHCIFAASIPLLPLRSYLKPTYLWAVTIALVRIIYPLFLAPLIEGQLTSDLRWSMTWMGLLYVTRRQLGSYGPLFQPPSKAVTKKVA